MTMNELRALATEDIVKKVRDYDETLEYLRSTANEIAANVTQDASIKKRLQKIESLMGEGVKAAKMLEGRVFEAEEGFRLLRFGLASELKKEWINVPAQVSDRKRAAIIPSDMGDVKKKRKTAGGVKKKKPRKKRAINPKKAAKMAEKKVAAAAKRAATKQKKTIKREPV